MNEIINLPENSIEIVKKLLENASGENVTMPDGVDDITKVSMTASDVLKLIQQTQLRTVYIVNTVEKIQARIIESVRGITSCAFCTNGDETRQAIEKATQNLGKELVKFRSDTKRILTESFFLELNEQVVAEMLSYILDLITYAESYYIIEPDTKSPDYRTRMRESHSMLEQLREYIAENDSRFVELWDMLSGIPKDIEVKRYIKRLATKFDESPKRGEYAEIGKKVYHQLRNFKKKSRKQRKAIEVLKPYFYDTGSIADKRGLGVFMSQTYQLQS